jgi:hypothetical protein
MLRRLTHVLVALVVAVAATMPAGAMPMRGEDPGAGQPCQQCPDRSMPDPMSGKMTLCPLLVCAGPLVVMPTASSIGTPSVHRIVYPAILPDRFAGAAPAPDPFPPRPIVFL